MHAVVLLCAAVAGELYAGYGESASYALGQLDAVLRCEDDDAKCADWASAGECEKNAGFMREQCAKSCNACGAHLESLQDRRTVTEVVLYALRSLCPDENLRRLCTVPVRRAVADIEEVAGRLLAQEDVGSFAESVKKAADAAAESVGMAEPLSEGVDTLPGAMRPAPFDRFPLQGGSAIPVLGFGTWQLTGDACYKAVRAALEAGYRHIDTAEVYRNEEEVGKAIADSGIPREDLFIATKLGVESYGSEESVRAVFNRQLELLQTDHVDLYMLHGVSADAEAQHSSWRALEGLKKEGKARAIGVSNFEYENLDDLLRNAQVRPEVLQNKLSPHHWGSQYRPDPNHDVVELARLHGVRVVGYSVLNPWPFRLSPLADPTVLAVAKAADKSPAQVLLRWAIDVGIAVIPRSATPEHIQENFGAMSFSLAPAAVRAISALHAKTETPWNRLPSGKASLRYFPPDVDFDALDEGGRQEDGRADEGDGRADEGGGELQDERRPELLGKRLRGPARTASPTGMLVVVGGLLLLIVLWSVSKNRPRRETPL